MNTIRVTPIQVNAARAWVLIDEAAGHETPDTIRKIAAARLPDDTGDDWREELRQVVDEARAFVASTGHRAS